MLPASPVEHATLARSPHLTPGSASRPTLLSLFSGGGLADLGFNAAGFEPVGAVEYDPDIAAVYAANLGNHITVSDVCLVDYRQWAGVTLVHLSPVCTNASQANSQAGETEEDLRAADACCRCLRETRPDYVTLENVQGYAKFESFRRIVAQLRELGYHVTWAVLNSANYGVPQTRRRLILRASRVGRVPLLPQTHCEGGKTGGLFGGEAGLLPWVGWYAAVEDLIPTLPESRFADWQLKRLPEWLESDFLVGSGNTNKADALPGGGVSAAREPSNCVNASNSQHWRAFLVDGQQTVPCANGERGVSVPHGDAPALTVCATATRGYPKALLVHGASTLDVRGAGDPSACVMSTVGAKAAMPKALLVGEQKGRMVAGEGRRSLPAATSEEPAFTLRAGENGGGYPRAWLEQGRVVAMTPRALARFQSLSDDYQFPDRAALATRIIGNGVPSLLAQCIGEAWLNGGAR